MSSPQLPASVRRGVAFLALAYVLAAFAHAALSPYVLWDFNIYWSATRTWLDGGDPYAVPDPSPADAAPVLPVEGGTLHSAGPPRTYDYPFLYPPGFLPLFAPVAALPYGAARVVFLLLKAMALAALFVVWRQWVRKSPVENGAVLSAVALDLFPLFVLFAFSGALLSDVLTGNITLFEQVLLWLGFERLARGRVSTGGALIVAAAAVKLSLVLFLPLVLLTGDSRGRWRRFAGLAAIFSAWVAVQWLLMPDLFARFLGTAEFARRHWDDGNLSALVFAGGVLKWVTGGSAPIAPDGGPAPAVWLAWAAAVVVGMGLFGRALIARRGRMGDEDARRAIVLLACALYAAVMPRMSPYSFVIVILPAFEALRASPARAALAAFLLFLIPIRGTMPTWGPGPWDGFQDCFPLVLTWITLGLLAGSRAARPAT